MTVNKYSTIGKLLLILMGITITSFEMMAQVEINKSLPEVFLNKKNGGNIDGSSWLSKELNGKINLVLYVAPDQQSSVQQLLDKIDSKNYLLDQFSVTLILNTEATWIPNSIIKSKVKNKAKEDSTKTYVLDKGEVVLNEWKLSEDSPNILLINEKGKVVFLYSEELTEEIENELISRIELQIDKGESK